MSRQRKARGRAPRLSRKPSSKRKSLLWILAFTLLAVLAAWIAHQWRLPTKVEIELTTSRFAFTLGGEKSQEILTGAPFTSLTLERPRSLTLRPESLRVAGTDAQWLEIEPETRVRFPGGDPDAKATLRSLGAPVRLTLPFLAAGSQGILEVAKGNHPTLTLELSFASTIGVPLDGEFELVTEFMPPEGLDIPTADLLTFRAALPETDALVEIESHDDGLVLVVDLPSDVEREIFPAQPRWPLEAMQFFVEGQTGEIESPVLAGTLRYPGTSVPDREIEAKELVRFESLDAPVLTSLALSETRDALDVTIGGEFTTARGLQGAFPVDYRLRLYDRVRHDHLWVLLAAVAAWAWPTAIKAWQFLGRRE